MIIPDPELAAAVAVSCACCPPRMPVRIGADLRVLAIWGGRPHGEGHEAVLDVGKHCVRPAEGRVTGRGGAIHTLPLFLSNS